MNSTDNRLEIFLANRSALIDYVASIVECRSRAEDVVQDAYFSFVADRAKAASAINVSYLYRIVRNIAIDFKRRRTIESRHTNTGAAKWLEPAGEANPEDSVLVNKELQSVLECLDNLPEKQRVAIEMYRLGGCTLAEVAKRLNVSIPTTHRIIRDAMLQITSYLDQA